MKNFQKILRPMLIGFIKRLVILCVIVIVSLVVVDEYYEIRQEEMFFSIMEYADDTAKYQFEERLESYGVYEIEDIEAAPSVSYI